ncbi:MAG: hypothetical protein II261_08360 [Bacteroidaceae bacterium]|nr:hypothetical protein [Bacteroidaceae bacterium]
MKTRKLMKLCLCCAIALTSACSQETELIAPAAVNTRAVAQIVLPKNPVYTLGAKTGGIYAAAPMQTVDASVWQATTQMDVTVVAPQALTLTGVSVQVNGSNIMFAEFRNADGENHVSLAKGEGISFTFPMMPATGQMTVRMHAAGTKTISQSVSGTVEAGTVCSLRFDNFTVTTGNNWITPLSDDTYLSQLSIPGTHDAGTGNGVSISAAKTQDLTLQQQWDMGIRVFDLRPGYKKVSKGWFKYVNELHIYHGIVATKISWDEAIDCLTANLKANPGEFAIIVMRFENDSPLYNNADTWNSLMNSYLTSELPAQYKVDFRPNLTVGDMRGKLLVLSRNAYASTPVTGAFVSGWNHGENGSTAGSIYSNAGTATLQIQDYYDVDNESQKLAAITNFMELASNNKAANVWTINHASGYTGLTNYKDNAANNHRAVYRSIIAGNGKAACTGMLMMDFVGKRKTGSYTVYGDLLPQAVIDNNYRR